MLLSLAACSGDASNTEASDGSENDASTAAVDSGALLPDAGLSTASPGCVDGSGLPEGENTFTLEGRDRRFMHPDGHIWPAFGSAAMWDFFQQFVEG